MRQEPLQALLDALAIREWDLLLVGDGSGSGRLRPLGWACMAIERLDITRRLFYGAANAGTVNNAEMLAYLLPLTWYASTVEDNRPRHVHIVTDSSYTRNTGEGKPSPKNHILWAAYQLLGRHGLILHWHWIPRATHRANKLADEISRAARLLLQNTDTAAAVTDRFGYTLDNCNPD